MRITVQLTAKSRAALISLTEMLKLPVAEAVNRALQFTVYYAARIKAGKKPALYDPETNEVQVLEIEVVDPPADRDVASSRPTRSAATPTLSGR